MVAQFQEENMGGRYVGTRQGFSNPDYRQLSRGFGIEKYYLIKSMDEFEKIRPSLQANLNLPEILEFSIDNAMKALPKMSFKTD
jgi:thiamine pyrophosphate-dependent acetolactate synthase large subunit-like protein